jgi:hypothetical protein
MKLRRWSRRLALVAGLALSAVASAETAVLPLRDGREVTVKVPSGMEFRVIGQASTPTLAIADAGKSILVQISFTSDLPSRFDTADKQKALLADLCHDDMEQSVEQQFNFKDLKPSSGDGLYLLLTDGNLINRTPPPGQYLKLTRGIRVSSDWVMVFSILSQSETSEAYRAAMAMVRGGVGER